MNYSQLTLHYFETAVGAGVLAGPKVYRGAAGDRAHGTRVQFDVQFSGGEIQAARFLAFACPHTIAVCAWIAEHAPGPISRAALRESVQDLSKRFCGSGGETRPPVDHRGCVGCGAGRCTAATLIGGGGLRSEPVRGGVALSARFGAPMWALRIVVMRVSDYGKITLQFRAYGSSACYV